MREIKKYVNCIQKETETSTEYSERQASARRAMEHVYGLIMKHIEVDTDVSPVKGEEGIASAFTFLNSDRTRHVERIKELEKVVEVGDDRIPNEQHKALELLVSNEERSKAEVHSEIHLWW